MNVFRMNEIQLDIIPNTPLLQFCSLGDEKNLHYKNKTMKILGHLKVKRGEGSKNRQKQKPSKSCYYPLLFRLNFFPNLKRRKTSAPPRDNN